MDKNIVALLREDTKTVGVCFLYDRETNPNRTTFGAEGEYSSSQVYTYITTFDCKVGDYVIVVANTSMKIARVVRVDTELAIEPNSDTTYKWVVDVIDTERYNKLVEENNRLQEVLSAAYKNNARKQFQDILLAGLREEDRTALRTILGERVGE